MIFYLINQPIFSDIETFLHIPLRARIWFPREIIGLSEDIKDKHVIILEDIVDTGTTIESVVKQLKAQGPASVKVGTMLFKPQAYLKNLMIDYIGLDIPNEFLVGYGLDYDGFGRNYEDIYSLIQK